MENKKIKDNILQINFEVNGKFIGSFLCDEFIAESEIHNPSRIYIHIKHNNNLIFSALCSSYLFYSEFENIDLKMYKTLNIIK